MFDGHERVRKGKVFLEKHSIIRRTDGLSALKEEISKNQRLPQSNTKEKPALDRIESIKNKRPRSSLLLVGHTVFFALPAIATRVI